MAITIEQQSNILKVVVGLFNAAPGARYLNNFAELVAGGTTIAQLADNLADSLTFTQGVVGNLTTTEENVSVLMDHFGLMPGSTDTASADAQAEAFFTGQINAGVGFGSIVYQAVTFLSSDVVPAEFITQVTLLNNKAAVSEVFSDTSDPADLNAAQEVLEGVPSDRVLTQAELNGLIMCACESFVLTTELDTITAGNGNDTIFALDKGALVSGDVVDGVGGSADTLIFLADDTSSLQIAPAVTNTEIIRMRIDGSDNDVKMSLLNSDGYNALWFDRDNGVDSVMTFNHINSTDVKLGAGQMTGNSDAEFHFAAGVLAGSDDVLTLEINGATDIEDIEIRGVDDEGAETVNIMSVGSEVNDIGNLYVTDRDGDHSATTFNITGSADLNINIDGFKDTNGNAMATVDANGLSGNFSIDVSGATQGVAITSGSGDDMIIGSEFGDVVSTGDGEDTLVGSAGPDQLIGGAAADIFDFSAAVSTAAAMSAIQDFAATEDDADAVITIGDVETDTTTGVNVSAADDELGTVTADIIDGVLTVSGADAANIDSLSEWIATAELAAADDALAGVLAFEFSGDTYVYDSDAAGDITGGNIVSLVGVTGVAVVDITAAADTILIA